MINSIMFEEDIIFVKNGSNFSKTSESTSATTTTYYSTNTPQTTNSTTKSSKWKRASQAILFVKSMEKMVMSKQSPSPPSPVIDYIDDTSRTINDGSSYLEEDYDNSSKFADVSPSPSPSPPIVPARTKKTRTALLIDSFKAEDSLEKQRHEKQPQYGSFLQNQSATNVAEEAVLLHNVNENNNHHDQHQPYQSPLNKRLVFDSIELNTSLLVKPPASVSTPSVAASISPVAGTNENDEYKKDFYYYVKKSETRFISKNSSSLKNYLTPVLVTHLSKQHLNLDNTAASDSNHNQQKQQQQQQQHRLAASHGGLNINNNESIKRKHYFGSLNTIQTELVNSHHDDLNELKLANLNVITSEEMQFWEDSGVAGGKNAGTVQNCIQNLISIWKSIYSALFERSETKSKKEQWIKDERDNYKHNNIFFF